MSIDDRVSVTSELGDRVGTIVGYVVKLDNILTERKGRTDYDYEYLVTGIDNQKGYELQYLITDGEIVSFEDEAAAAGGQGGGKRKRQSRKTRKNRK